MSIDRDDHGLPGHPLPGALRLSGRHLHDARLLVRDVLCALADEWTAAGVAGSWFVAFDRAARLQEALGTVDAAPIAPAGAISPDLAEALLEFASDEVRLAWKWLAEGVDDPTARVAVEEREARAGRVLQVISEGGGA